LTASVGLLVLRWINTHETGYKEFHRVLFALAIGIGGIVISCVFIFTDPPAFEKLPNLERGIIGVLSTVIAISFCGKEVLKFLRRRSGDVDPHEPPDLRPEPIQPIQPPPKVQSVQSGRRKHKMRL
jgi:O-antigen ligase